MGNRILARSKEGNGYLMNMDRILARSNEGEWVLNRMLPVLRKGMGIEHNPGPF